MSTFERVFRALTEKRGQFSKTSLFLSIAIIVTLLLWPFQSLFAGTAFGWWVVPEFNSEAALAVIGVISGLYVTTHSRLVSGSPPSREPDDGEAR